MLCLYNFIKNIGYGQHKKLPFLYRNCLNKCNCQVKCLLGFEKTHQVIMTIQVLTCLVHNNITYYLSWVIVNRNIALTVLKKVNFKFFPYVNRFITGQHKSLFAKANNIGSSSKYARASVFFYDSPSVGT